LLQVRTGKLLGVNRSKTLPVFDLQYAPGRSYVGEQGKGLIFAKSSKGTNSTFGFWSMSPEA
jgi:hypothetical protein